MAYSQFIRPRAIGLLAGLLAASPAAGAVITTATGNGADAYVRSGTHANSNFGASPLLGIKAESTMTDFNRKAYFLFDLSSATELPSATSASLSFVFNAGGGSRVFNVFGVNDGTAGEIFSEGTGTDATAGTTGITWNNAPGNDVNSTGGVYNTGTATGGGVDNAVTTFLGTFTASGGAGTTYTLNSSTSPALLSFLNADTNDRATFIITRATLQTADNDIIRAKETAGVANHPTLTIVPEPATAGLLAATAAGLLLRRRQRTHASR